MLLRTAVALALFIINVTPVANTTARHDDEQENAQLCMGAADPDVRVDRCTALIRSGQESKNELGKVYVYRGLAYWQLGQIDRALEDDEQAIRLNPSNIGAFVGRARVHAEQGQFDRVIEDCNRVVQIDPKNVVGFAVRGFA